MNNVYCAYKPITSSFVWVSDNCQPATVQIFERLLALGCIKGAGLVSSTSQAASQQLGQKQRGDLFEH